MLKLKVNDFVINTIQLGDIVINSVGVVKKVYNKLAEVYFIGKDKLVTTDMGSLEFLDVEKTGKPYPKKICNRCFILKDDYVDFEINQTDKKGRSTTRPSCRECRKDIDGETMSAAERAKGEATRPKAYEIFTCPICGKVSIPFVTANLVKDHNHKTGKFRGWLCDSCNTGLGRFQDDIELMQKAIDYLKQKEKEEQEKQEKGLFEQSLFFI